MDSLVCFLIKRLLYYWIFIEAYQNIKKQPDHPELFLKNPLFNLMEPEPAFFKISGTGARAILLL